ncbi:hypothetical protein FHY55_05130 [Oceanicola sp. D3]|uniref:hypothetical protein n=1 Tax=Oceanicola sp. D3 TaxID=2587163 RepID=UPI0011227FBC|nr:hypothetical protein [Oceanicola sp. D3]QDC08660.1 hypothetical protein FHY55_05130 [Oceanicola sp. D3]
MLRISALTVLIALGASLHAANAGSFATDLPRVTFTSASTASPSAPELPDRSHSAPAILATGTQAGSK